MTIKLPDFIEWVEHIPEDNKTLFASVLRDRVKKDPIDAFKWYKKVEAQEKHKGQMIDFTQRRRGSFLKWFSVVPVGICPVCGRRGLVNTDPAYVQFTEHVVFIFGGMGHTNLDVCEWGEKWYSPYNSPEKNHALLNGGIREISSPNMMNQNIHIYTKDDNFGLTT